jgi:hypothetical protein
MIDTAMIDGYLAAFALAAATFAHLALTAARMLALPAAATGG